MNANQSSSPFKSKAEFLKRLQDLHNHISKLSGSAPQQIKFPILGHKELDLLQLYDSVIKRGGVKKVVENKQWHNVVKELKLPSV